MTDPTDLTVFIDPPSHHFLQDALFDPHNAKLNRDNVLAPYHLVRERLARRGIPVHTADLLLNGRKRSRHNLYVSTGILSNYRALVGRKDVTLAACFAFEIPIVEPTMYREMRRAQDHFQHIYSWSDSAALERFAGGPLRCEQFWWPQPFTGVHERLWAGTGRKFLTMINSNKLPRVYWQELYTERRKAVEYFSRTDEIDLYGMGWAKPAHRVGKSWMPYTLRRAEEYVREQWHRLRPDPLLQAARRVYRGAVAAKAEVLGQYTFALCFENMILKGCITEKIFDCLHAGTTPVYWGAPDIADYVPKGCFIDMRNFSSYAELARYLKSLDRRAIEEFRENGRQYLHSAQFHRFTAEAFADLFDGLVAENQRPHAGPASP